LPRTTRSTALALCLIAVPAAAGCRDAGSHGSPPTAAPATRSATSDATRGVLRDDFGDSVIVAATPPERIVSLVPATTEMLYAIGAGARLVGRTRWDDYPPAVRRVPDVGDALRPNVEAVLARRPDLVLLYASADDRDAALRLRAAGVATLSLRIDRVADFRRALAVLGSALHDSARAAAVADSVLGTLARVRAATAGASRVSVVWQVEITPVIVIGGGSFLDELLRDAGGRNLYGEVTVPAPQVSLEDLLDRAPEVVLTSPAGARAIRVDPRWGSWLSMPGHRLLVPDTAVVGLPSVRMGEAAVELATLLHPELRGRIAPGG